MLRIGTATMALLLIAGSALAQEEEKKLGWANVADFGLVVTSGNTSTQTVTLDNKTTRTWENAEFGLRGGILRTKTADDRFAVGTENDFDVIEDDQRDLDNERYYFSGDYKRNLNPNLYWLAGAGWDRDKNAGIENRTVVYGGVGNIWADRDVFQLKTDYAITFTRRIDEIPDDTRDERFAEARLSSNLMRKLNANNQVDSDFVFFVNTAKASDYRFNTINALTSNLNSHMALRFSLQFLYQNFPALEELDLFDPAGDSIGVAVVRKKKLDTVLKFALVITL